MSEPLPLRSLKIEGFRAIRHLQIPEMGKVTLFVGPNNAGKTSLLEAVHLYLHRGSRSVAAILLDLLRDRSGFRPRFSTAGGRGRTEIGQAEVETAIQAVEALFNGAFQGGSLRPIRIGAGAPGDDAFVLSAPWAESHDPSVVLAPETPLLRVEGGDGAFDIPVDWFLRRISMVRPSGQPATSIVIPATGLDSHRIRTLWDRAAVSGHEEVVESVMRNIVPDLDRVLLVGENGRRSVLVRLQGMSRPIPLQSMGDGTNRVFGIALAMIQARGGVVLIDEVENGLHFEVQDEVWRAVFSLARQLDVQVLATTHSWDTIVGFQYAANLSEEEGMLYRLEREPDGQVDAIHYSEKELEIAADQRIEVR